VQYANENQFDNIDLIIYPGANATFTLYEDEGDNYNYEQGSYTTIPLTWNDRSHTLTIGQRTGSFPGMPTTRTFHVRIIGGPEKTVTYTGKAITVK
jgi:alpha-D-xyloside xylohydrolase